MEYTRGEWRFNENNIVSGYVPEQELIAIMNEDEDERKIKSK